MQYPKAVIKKCTKDEDVIEIDERRLLKVDKGCITHCGEDVVEQRNYGNLKNKSYYLSRDYEWMIVKDSDNYTVLIPLKKEEGC